MHEVVLIILLMCCASSNGVEQWRLGFWNCHLDV